MNLRTPLIASLAVVSALGGVALAAIALPSGSASEPAVAAVPSATPAPEVRTTTIHRTIHVVRRHKGEDASSTRSAAPAITPAATASLDDSAHPRPGGDDAGPHGGGDGAGRQGGGDEAGPHGGGEDPGRHGGGDDAGHRGGGDASGHGRGRG